jgi:hypothetical protein
MREAVKDGLENNGLAFIQQVQKDENGAHVLKTTLIHESGETISSFYPIFTSKNDAQGFGSGVTYARRYALQTLLGIPADDDDGNAASSNTTATGGSKSTARTTTAAHKTAPAGAGLSLEEIKGLEGVSVEETDTKIIISGKTFNLSNDLRGLGFSWDGKTKTWFKEVNKLPLETAK